LHWEAELCVSGAFETNHDYPPVSPLTWRAAGNFMRIKFRPPAAGCPRQLPSVQKNGQFETMSFRIPSAATLRTIHRSELQLHKRIGSSDHAVKKPDDFS